MHNSLEEKSHDIDTHISVYDEKKQNHNYEMFGTLVAEFIPIERIITDPLGTIAHGTDASIYQLIPKIVLIVEDEDEIIKVISLASKFNIPITFRAAGTSLSGQAVTDQVLIKLGENGWRKSELLKNGAQICLEPGLTGAQANRKLTALNKKIGPDPASINSAMIGGIAANNSSGMCCGVAQNTYQTVKFMRIVLADGAVLDTSCEKSCAGFKISHRKLLENIEELRDDLQEKPGLIARINKKYSIKNTTGYSLNALVDFHDPIDILQHLIIGSEGTLAFISNITLDTVEDPPHKACCLIFFSDIEKACQAVDLLKSSPVSAVELMDYAALKSIENNQGVTHLLSDLPVGAAALLIDVRAENNEQLNLQIKRIKSSINSIEILRPFEFSLDAKVYNLYWSVRKGLFPQVGAVREVGTSVIIEDIAVNTERLADAVIDLQSLFEKHSYHNAIIFGHALEGNLHFVFSQDFNDEYEVHRYEQFMDELTALIVNKYDGSLKAEHSTGRNMAPFVEREWGKDAYAIMQRVKTIIDPQNILNPGVILNSDPNIHLKNLKTLPSVDPLIDKCIECGFCEATCPTKSYSLTPRQRIVALREIKRLENAVHKGADIQKDAIRERIKSSYSHQGIDSCAGDGLCSLSCPVGIDTGQMMRQLRQKETTIIGKKMAAFLAANFSLASHFARLAIFGTRLFRSTFGRRFVPAVTKIFNKLSFAIIPEIIHDLPAPLPPFTPKARDKKKKDIVFFSSCAARVIGRDVNGDSIGLAEVIQSLFNKAGYNLIQPPSINGLCCGMPFESKGFFDIADQKTEELSNALKMISNNGERPIVFDTSPCTLRVRRVMGDRIKVYDITEAIIEFVMSEVDIQPVAETVALHVTCSARRLGLADKVEFVARACAKNVIIPDDINCCGFAGDKGFQLPELNSSALRHLKEQLPPSCAVGYSTSCTCELGLTTHSNRSYQSIAYLVNKCAKEKTE